MATDWDAFEEEARTLDAADPLAHTRARFDLPDGILYFDGNSLGPLTHEARRVLDRTVSHGWRERLIRSWDEDWMDMPSRVGDLIAPLIGAAPGTVVCTDNTSVNLHKALESAVAMRPGRDEIITDVNNFPTDIYIARSVAERHGMTLTAVKASQIPGAVSERTAVVTATHVDYRSAHILHADEITPAAHAAGALVVWDLAHSVGAVPVDLAGLDADFAVGCGYKYLNGGPGAPAFVYVAPRLLAEASQPLHGWWAHDEPMAFETGFRPAAGIKRFLTGSPGVLSMKALEAALTAFEGVTVDQLRAKSVSLTEFFVRMWDEQLQTVGFSLESPRDPVHRGSHVALGFAGGKQLVADLADRDVIADFRPPDLVRFGFAPLYNTHLETARLARKLAELASAH
ncbi:MAG: kynureninase [Actinomycetes bacterium]|jgi:kynureninase